MESGIDWDNVDDITLGELDLPMMIGQARDVRIVTFKHDFNDDHTQYYMSTWADDHGKLTGLVEVGDV